jgi:hypothetical protein
MLGHYKRTAITVALLLSLAITATLTFGMQKARAQTRGIQTFRGKGQISAIAINLHRQQMVNNIVSGNWSLDVSGGKIRDFTISLVTNNSGKQQVHTISGLATNMIPILLDNNNTSFQGTAKENQSSFKMAFSITNGYTVKIILTKESSEQVIYGTTDSLVDASGKELLKGALLTISC